MNKVSSYRFNEPTNHRMEIMSKSLGISEKDIIECAVRNYFEKYEEDWNGYDTVIVDFHKNFEGVNTDVVQDFIQEVSDLTHFKLHHYGDDHQVHFYREEEI